MRLLSAIHRCDVSVFTWLAHRKGHALFARIGRLLSRTGDGHFYALLGLYLLLSSAPANRLFLACLLFAFGLERPIYFVLKNSLRRHRPQEVLKNFRGLIRPSDRFSFPSGHTSAAFCMATVVAYFHPALAIPAYAWASSLGAARLVLGVHFPTDIVAGMTMGTTVASLSLRMLA